MQKVKEKLSAIVNRVKAIVFKPKETWPVIATEEVTIMGLGKQYLLILAAVPSIAALIGNWIVGYYNPFIHTIRLSFFESLLTAILQYILLVIGIWGTGMIISLLAPTFGSTRDDLKGFKVAVFTYTPVLAAGILLIIPSLSPLVGLIGLYGFYLLYIGLPVVMGTPKEKSLAYIAVIVIVVILIFIIISTVTNAVLRIFGPSIL
ncbi:MAG TPA: YIP1 family protein [bacterium]|nr:YIP1 family protein [bacterium]